MGRDSGAAMIEKPRKGEGMWRHCYIGQEDKLMQLLRDKGLSIEQFNQVWDAIMAEEAREQVHSHGESMDYRQDAVRRVKQQITGQNPEHTEPFDLFVPSFAPRYQEMVDRGGIPDVSVEDNTRHGVWVRLSWYSQQTKQQKPLAVAEQQQSR